MAFEELKVTKTIRWINPGLNLNRQFGIFTKSNVAILSYEQNITSWYMMLYPNGERDDARGCVGLFLYLESAKSKDFLAKWSFTLRNENGFTVKKASVVCRGHDFLYGFGSTKFITHQELSKHVKDWRSFTIICELSIYGPKQQEDGEMGANVALPMRRDFKKMFQDEILCDLDIKTNDGVTFKAHKAILAAKSPVLMKMLTTDMKETNTSIVVIDGLESGTIRELLRFIYCGEVEDFERNAKQLIYVAEKYEVTELKEKCIEEIASKLTKENVIEALMIADYISGADKLIKACLPIIDLYLLEMMKNPKWKALSKNMLGKLMTSIWNVSKTYDV